MLGAFALDHAYPTMPDRDKTWTSGLSSINNETPSSITQKSAEGFCHVDPLGFSVKTFVGGYAGDMDVRTVSKEAKNDQVDR